MPAYIDLAQVGVLISVNSCGMACTAFDEPLQKEGIMHRAIRIAVLVSTTLTAPLGRAWASGSQQPIALHGVSASASVASPDVGITILSDRVEELDVQSRLYGPGGTQLPPRYIGVTVVSPAVAAKDHVPSAETVVAGPGDSVTLPSPQALSLPPGLYAETIIITVAGSRFSASFDIAGDRYFEVTTKGITPVSEEEYSRRTEQTFTSGGVTFRSGVFLEGTPNPSLPTNFAVPCNDGPPAEWLEASKNAEF